MLLREGANGRDEVREGDECECRRGEHEIEEVTCSDSWQPDRGQPALDLADDGDPMLLQVEERRNHECEREYHERRRQNRKDAPSHDCRRQQPRAQEHGRPVRVAERRQNLPHDGEEVVRADADPEELAELGRDHDQRDPVDVAEQHRLAEEVRDETQPDRTCQEEQQTHRQRQSRSERHVARRVDLPSDHGHRGYRHSGQRRQRRVGPDDVLPRRPEQPVDRER